jgi:small subunit ribosomal protein S19e
MKSNPVYEMPANVKQIPEFKQPEWTLFVKSGVAKVKPPQEKDFWHKRAASILRQIYIYNIVGVNKLRTRYGSKKNRGMRPERFRKASGKIIRVILQQAEQAELLEKQIEPGKRAGRKLTKKGKELLEGISNEEKEIPKKKLTDISEKKIEKTEKELAKEVTKIEDKVKEHEITQKQADKEIKEEVKEDVEELKEGNK